MTTTRTNIVLALGCIVMFSVDAWKNIPTDKAVQEISPFINREMPITREWFWKILTLYAVPWIMSLIMIIDSRAKDPLKKGLYWTMFLLFSFLLFKYLWDFDKDNYFYLFMFLPVAMFLIGAGIRYHKRNDIVFSVKRWFYNLFKKNEVRENVTEVRISD